MQLKLIDGLPYTTVTIAYENEEINIDYVLVDTGSASTIFSSDHMGKIGISPKPDDPYILFGELVALKLFLVVPSILFN